MTKEVHVVLASNDAYALYCAATIHSVFKASTRPESIHVHVLTSGLSPRSGQLLQDVAAAFRSSLTIHEIALAATAGLGTLSHISADTYSRLFAADKITAVDKFIYLDCDVAVCTDLAPLMSTPLLGAPVAAVVHQNTPLHQDFASRFQLAPVPGYVNAGVLVIDAAAWRAENAATRLTSWMQENRDRLAYSDQCAINHYFLNRITHLHPRWNVEVRHYRDRWCGVTLSAELYEAIEKPAVLHYTGPIKPWDFRAYVPKRSVYLTHLNSVLLLAGRSPVIHRNTVANAWREIIGVARFRGGALRRRLHVTRKHVAAPRNGTNAA